MPLVVRHEDHVAVVRGCSGAFCDALVCAIPTIARAGKPHGCACHGNLALMTSPLHSTVHDMYENVTMISTCDASCRDYAQQNAARQLG
jgi:hypothetical protein